MSAALMVCLGLVEAAAALTWWVAFGLAARTDQLGELILVGLVGHLGQFEAELDCAPDPGVVAALAVSAAGGAA